MARSQYAEGGFSLLETVVAVAVMAVGTVFMLRAFAGSLDAVRKAVDTFSVCYLAEEKIWYAACRQMNLNGPAPALSGREKRNGRDFSWECESRRSGIDGPFDLSLRVSWDKGRLELSAKALGGM